MDSTIQCQLDKSIGSNSTKKIASLIALLDANTVDKSKIKEYFLKSQTACLLQEFRLSFWKPCLGISSKKSEKTLENHYKYLKHVIQNVLEFNETNPNELNYCIYLLDKDYLPLNENYTYDDNEPFCLIYRQLCEILDDQTDFESYYLTVQLYDLLKDNLNQIREKLDKFVQANDINNKSIIQKLNKDKFILSALAGLFNNIKMYHIIWDRLVMGEFEMLLFAIISLLETFKEDSLNLLLEYNHKNTIDVNIVKKLGIDQSKILRKSAEYYNNFHKSHQNIYNLIINYYNK